MSIHYGPQSRCVQFPRFDDSSNKWLCGSRTIRSQWTKQKTRIFILNDSDYLVGESKINVYCFESRFSNEPRVKKNVPTLILLQNIWLSDHGSVVSQELNEQRNFRSVFIHRSLGSLETRKCNELGLQIFSFFFFSSGSTS